MGLFDIFKNENVKKANEEKDIDFRNCIEIAKIISNNDEGITKEMEDCIANPISYFNKYESDYEERGILDFDDKDIIVWIGLVDCLLKNNYVCELDWKDGLSEFIYFMSNLKNSVKFDEEILNENGKIVDWCTKLDEELQKQNLCVGGIDIDSDSYVLFICDNEKLKKLNQLSMNISHKITLGRKL